MEASERIAFYSIAVNFSLVICKYGLAVFSGSLALRADAIHSSADIVSAASRPVVKDTLTYALPLAEDRQTLSSILVRRLIFSCS